MSQHLVPKAHLQRFTFDGSFLWVFRKDIKKLYRKNISKVCVKDNYYDDNPYELESNERFIKNIEDRGQVAIDSILNDDVGNDTLYSLKQYMINLLYRSVKMRQSIKNVFNDAGLAIEEYDLRDCQTIMMRDFKDEYLKRELDGLYCFVRTVQYPQFLLIGDAPINIIGFSDSNVSHYFSEYNNPNSTHELFDVELSSIYVDAMRKCILALPLNSSTCAFMIGNEYRQVENNIPEPLDSKTIRLINSMIITNSDEIYSSISCKDYILDIIQEYEIINNQL